MHNPNSPDPQHPCVGVGIIVVRDMTVLMGKRKGSFGAGTWAFPGGHLEWNEEVAACARREIKEETGLEIKNLYYGPYTNDILLDEGKHYITVLIMARCESGEPQLLEPEKCEEWGWFEWNHMPQPLFVPTQNILKLDFSPWRWSGLKAE